MPSIDYIYYINIISIIVLVNGMFQNLIHFLELVIAFFALKTRSVASTAEEAWWSLSDTTMPISILMPAYNEEAGVVEAVKSMLALHYPNFEVIVINDGSKDETLNILVNEFKMFETEVAYEEALKHKKIKNIYKSLKYNKLTVINKENGGKADAQNAGINIAKFSHFCIVDGDSILESDALLRVVQPFANNPEKVVAVGGSIRIANGSDISNGRLKKLGLPKNILALFQIIEYLRAFLVARLALSKIKSTILISGAFGVYKRSVVMEVGGFSHNTIGEDMEIIMKMHRYLHDNKRDYEMLFTPEPVCWTECPSDLKSLGSQRARWQQGALEVFFKHIRMFANPKYGLAGMLSYLYIFSADVIGPIIEFIGLIVLPIFWYMGILNIEFMLAFFAVTFTFGVFFSVSSLILSEMELQNYKKPSQLIILTLAAILENFGYRQINNFWRFKGWIRFLLKKEGWGSMKRKGLSKN